MLKHRLRPQCGITLIEVMITVAIVGVLLAIGISSFRVWIENNKTRNAAESFVAGLTIARTQAIVLSSSVQFYPPSPQTSWSTGTSWSVGCVNWVAVTCPQTIQTRQMAEGSSSTVVATKTDGTPLAFSAVEYNNLGRMFSPLPTTGTSVTIQINNTKLSATDARPMWVIIDSGGSVRMCDPAVSDVNDPRHC